MWFIFFFNDTATTEIYTLSLHDALPIWLPAGTHRWDRFVTPNELGDACSKAGLEEVERKGMVFNPLAGDWRLARDTDVNYLMSAARPE